ncbi:major facilitator superfamily domain-containing protein 1-like [Phymastichus coffea]|uniref:major facilitator superfamily domain-containing protein 1-like n=1 Tax=Phymastichus coffea TaxID=108790 RepID=UPI00273AF4F9|nr:major facilitator superfamily domain-containing protein 1-like [Phymastichus coffea]
MDNEYKACSISGDDFTSQTHFSIKKTLFKYFGLLNICLLSFGLYFCYDNPGTLQDKFETDLKVPTTKFVLLYSIYSWPNVVLCFFGGVLLDSVFGIKWGTIVYMFLALLGQLLFATGAFVNIFWIMVFGRFIFGIGSEAVYIAQNNYTVLWFKDKGLNALFGLQSSIGLAGSIANSLSMGTVYKFVENNSNYSTPQCIGTVLFIASLTCVLSMICALVLGCMHSRTETVLKQEKAEKAETFKLSDIKEFPTVYWLVILLCTAYTVALSPFISLAQVYFMTKYNMGSDAANKLNSLVYTISAIISPLFGIMIDKFGRNILWVTVGIIGSIFAHGLLTFIEVSPYFSVSALGFFSSLFGTSIWPMIADVMPEHQLGTAYGINQAILNFSIAVASIVCGLIVENYGYFVLDVFFLLWLFLSLVPAVIIWKAKSKQSHHQVRYGVEESRTNLNGVKEALVHSTAGIANKQLVLAEQELIQRDNNFLNR